MKCPSCNKEIGFVPKTDVHGRKLKLPVCPYKKGRR